MSVLRAESISKSFGPIEVLSGISLDLRPGEVHAVIGENGAGKSTLMRILSGHLPPTNGNLLSERAAGHVLGAGRCGKPGHRARSPGDPARRGSDGRAESFPRPRNRGATASSMTATMRDASRAILRELGAGIDPDTQVRRLSIADRQLVQIARALLVPHQVVAFDEPTAVLTPDRGGEPVRDHPPAARPGRRRPLHLSPAERGEGDRGPRDGAARRHALWPLATSKGLEPIEMARLMVGRDMSKLYPEKPDDAPPTRSS